MIHWFRSLRLRRAARRLARAAIARQALAKTKYGEEFNSAFREAELAFGHALRAVRPWPKFSRS